MDSAKLLGRRRRSLDPPKPRPAGAVERRLDGAQARRVLGVRPGVVLERGWMGEVEPHRVAGTVTAAWSDRRAGERPHRDRRRGGRRRRGRPLRRAARRRAGARVTLVSRKPLAESASYWAQGGLAAALAPDDSPARHADDTLNAGRGLCRTEAVQTLTREAPAAVEELRRLGVRFDTEADGSLGLALEGGHRRAGSFMPAAPRRGARSRAAWRSRSPPRTASRCWSRPRRSPCGADGPAGAPGWSTGRRANRGSR